jgi:hypothetical protein
LTGKDSNTTEEAILDVFSIAISKNKWIELGHYNKKTPTFLGVFWIIKKLSFS